MFPFDHWSIPWINNLEWFQTGRCSCALSQLLSQLASWPALGSAQFVTCAGGLIVFSFLHWWGFLIHQVMWLSRSDYIINDVFFPLGVQADTLNPVHVCKAAALRLSQSSLSYLGKVLQSPLHWAIVLDISVSLNESHAIKRVLAIPCQSNHQASWQDLV